MNEPTFVGFAGIIGAGKTKLSRGLHEIFGERGISSRLYEEPVASNPYLGKFYEDMENYAFRLQVFFLGARFRMHQSGVWSQARYVIQDRTLYEDPIFATMLFEDRIMSGDDYETYKLIYESMVNYIHFPHFIIYLDVTPETAMERIKKRSRGAETGITLEYLRRLRSLYETWFYTFENRRCPIFRLFWNDNDEHVLKSGSKWGSIVKRVKVKDMTEEERVDLILGYIKHFEEQRKKTPLYWCF